MAMPAAAFAGPRNRYGLPPRRAGAAPSAAPAIRSLPRTLRAPALPAPESRDAALAAYEDGVRAAFDAIEPALREIAALQHAGDFGRRAQALARERLGFELPAAPLAQAWVRGLDVRGLYARCVFETVRRVNERTMAELAAEREAAQALQRFFRDCGFHRVDVSHCSDGRLLGTVRYVLRLPHTAVRREAYAGARFDVEAAVQAWAETELDRWRSGASEPTRYLKAAVYHYSGSRRDEGCAAHDNDRHSAAAEALARLEAFRGAIENRYCCGVTVATLLLGVDTDTDAVTLHLPDARGELNLHRRVDNAAVAAAVAAGTPAQRAIDDALAAAAAADGWGRGQGAPDAGVLALCAFLLRNNLAQIAYVRARHGGPYPDIGHAERFLSAGNGYADEQLRNAAFYVRLDTVEEAAADLDVGVRILCGHLAARGLAVPALIHCGYDGRIPGGRDRAAARALRVEAAIRARYAGLAGQGLLATARAVQDTHGDGALEFIGGEGPAAPPPLEEAR